MFMRPALPLMSLIAPLAFAMACSEGGGEVAEPEASPEASPEATPEASPEADVGLDAEPEGVEPEAPDVGMDAAPDEVEDVPPACTPDPEICDGKDNDCDGQADEGEDVATQIASDPGHCGACGRACDFTGGSGECVEGECVFFGCEPLHLDMDGRVENGCEVRAQEPRSLLLSPGTPKKVLGFGPWVAVLDGEAVWLYLASTGELVDVEVLTGAVDAAFDEARSLLVVVGKESLAVLDVMDAGLRHRGWYEGVGNDMRGVALKGHFAFVANYFNTLGDSRAFVFDLSDPSEPAIAHREVTLRGTTHLSMLDEDHLVTVSVSTGLSVYDVRYPERPRLLSFDYYQAWPSQALAIDRERALAYVSTQGAGVHVFDLSNLEQVERIGEITERTTGQDNVALLVEGSQVWTADYTRLRRFDMSNPRSPRRVAIQSLTGVSALEPIDGAGAFMVTTSRSWSFPMNTYNINGGSVHRAALTVDGAQLEPDPLFDGEQPGEQAHLYALGEHLLSIDRNGLSTLYSPQGEGRDFDLGAPIWQQYMGIWSAQVVEGQLHAVTSTYSGRLNTADYTVFTIGDPALGLTEVTRTPFDCLQSGIQPYNLRVAGDRAVVICGGWDTRQVQTLDLSAPGAPRGAGRLEGSLPVYFIESTDGQLVTSTRRRVLYREAARLEGFRLPVDNLETPNWSFIPEGLPTGMVRHGSTLYLRTDRGLHLLDLRIDDGYVPVDIPDLPGPVALGAAPPIVLGDHALLATRAGAVLIAEAGAEGFEPPRVAGQLTRAPIHPLSAARIPGAILALERRRLLVIPLEEPETAEP